MARRTGRREAARSLVDTLRRVAVVALVIGSGVLASTPTRHSGPRPSRRTPLSELRGPVGGPVRAPRRPSPSGPPCQPRWPRAVPTSRSSPTWFSLRRLHRARPAASGWPCVAGAAPRRAWVASRRSAVLVRRHPRRPRVEAAGGRGGPDGWHDAEADDRPDRLADRRPFLVRSLSDADAEYLAGDLSDRDYLALRRRDMQRLAASTPTSRAPLGTGDSVRAVGVRSGRGHEPRRRLSRGSRLAVAATAAAGRPASGQPRPAQLVVPGRRRGRLRRRLVCGRHPVLVQPAPGQTPTGSGLNPPSRPRSR